MEFLEERLRLCASGHWARDLVASRRRVSSARTWEGKPGHLQKPVWCPFEPFKGLGGKDLFSQLALETLPWGCSLPNSPSLLASLWRCVARLSLSSDVAFIAPLFLAKSLRIPGILSETAEASYYFGLEIQRNLAQKDKPLNQLSCAKSPFVHF